MTRAPQSANPAPRRRRIEPVTFRRNDETATASERIPNYRAPKRDESLPDDICAPVTAAVAYCPFGEGVAAPLTASEWPIPWILQLSAAFVCALPATFERRARVWTHG
jgi:hypothetical protein